MNVILLHVFEEKQELNNFAGNAITCEYLLCKNLSFQIDNTRFVMLYNLNIYVSLINKTKISVEYL